MQNESHPCAKPGCNVTVPFDDEPYCFADSPDSGSDLRGYSYAAGHPVPQEFSAAAETSNTSRY